MDIEKINVIVEPLLSGEKFYSEKYPNATTVHADAKYIELINELQNLTTAKVILVEDILEKVHLEGFILLYPHAFGMFLESRLAVLNPKIQRELCQRLVLLNVVHGDVYSLSRKFGIVAGVTNIDYKHWFDLENTITQRQEIFGLRTIAKGIGATILSEEGRYCSALGNTRERLPSLLIRYLEEYTNQMDKLG